MTRLAKFLIALLIPLVSRGEEPRRVLFIAGPPSHPWGTHEHLAGFRLAAEWLHRYATGVVADVSDGWPADVSLLDRADAIVINSDGGRGNIIVTHAAALDKASTRGAGIGILHWALDIPDPAVRTQALEWIGGYFETHWSVNPEWTADVKIDARHPVTRGVKPFRLRDEWYFHMRFREGLSGVLPLIFATPPDAVRDAPDGPYSNNRAVRARKGEREVLGWVSERANGGRGFGFTGLHYHWNWAHPDYRMFLLNSFVWLAGAEVPAVGIQTPAPDAARLMQDIPKARPANRDPAKMQRYIDRWVNEPID